MKKSATIQRNAAWALPGLLLAVCTAASSQTPVPIGTEFQANSLDPVDQPLLPALAMTADGAFVIVWQAFGSSGTDSSARSIQGKLYDSTGMILGNQFQINTCTTDNQSRPSVSMTVDGSFVVAWESYGSSGTDTDYSSVQAQRFDSVGIPVDEEFQVNTYTTLPQFGPAVGVDSDGDFVIAWMSILGAGNYDSVQAQMFGSSGTPLGGEFQVNSYSTSSQDAPSVSVSSAGDFVVVWTSQGSSGTDTSSSSILGQRYDAAGAPLGEEFQVNSYTTGAQLLPAISESAAGDIVVVWESGGSGQTDTSAFSIQGQRYDATGAPVGEEFQVNSYTSGMQIRPSVSVGQFGDFVVAWSSYGSVGTDSDQYSVQAQRFDAAGASVGEQFQVNSYTEDGQWFPSVSLSSGGDFVVVWESYESYGTAFRIRGQRFATPIFTNGFESGDTSAWSSSQ